MAIAISQLPAATSVTDADLVPIVQGGVTKRVTVGALVNTSFLFAQEVPSGTVNGSNAAFALSAAPVSSASLLLFVNGLAQRQGVGFDYTTSGANIVFESGSVPQTGDVILAYYPR